MNYEHYNNRILYVINPKGEIRKLYVPFRIQDYANGNWVYVEEVRCSSTGELAYIIHGKEHPYHSFFITIGF